jgi:glutathione S-transferase
MAGALPTLYQAEWCPFSSAVREVLTELGIDVIVRQVEPAPEQRAHLRAIAGTDEIPVLIAEDGEAHCGTRAIFAHLRKRPQGAFGAGHRGQYAAHREARQSGATDRLIERFRSTEDLESPER